MSEEGEKVEISKEPLADVHPVSDCEKITDEQSKMADGQPPQVSEGGEEIKSNNQEASGLADAIEKTESSQENNLTDGNEEVTQVLESETKSGEVKETTAEEESSQSLSSNPSVADEPQVVSEETPSATPENTEAELPSNSDVSNDPQSTLERIPATTPEEPQTEVVSESQPASSDVANESKGASEDAPAATSEEPQAVATEENAAVTPMKAEATAPEENHAANLDESSASTDQTASAAPEAVEKEASEKSMTDASTDQDVSENHEVKLEQSNSVKRAPPKVLPKPKYEPPEIKVDLFIKAHASFPNKLGDCPFCHRIMMTLKLKKIGGTVCPVNLSVKSREFEDFCAKHGLPTKVPIIQHGETVMCDSNAIADYLDKIRPVPKLVCLSKATNAAGDKVFLKFSALIKNKIKSNDEKLANALTDELSRLDNFLSTSPGCFLDGDDLLHPDCILLPKLHHVRIAAKHYKKYDIPENLKYLNSYLAAADKHPVFASTKPSDDAVIEGWRKHAT